MKYEKPEMEIIEFTEEEICTLTGEIEISGEKPKTLETEP